MIRDDDKRDGILTAVLTAAATTAATALVTWAVDELRAKYGSKKNENNPTRGDQ